MMTPNQHLTEAQTALEESGESGVSREGAQDWLLVSLAHSLMAIGGTLLHIEQAVTRIATNSGYRR